MTQTRCYPLNVAIGAELQGPASACHPFNIRFNDCSREAGIALQELSGPGIYTVSFNREVIYLGKYQPYERGNILTDRWIRHIETLTLRGNRVGFNGASNPSAKLNQLLKQIRSAELADGLRQACPLRFKDTGVVTTPSKIRFADQMWECFSKSTPHNIFDGFEFSLAHLEGLSSTEDAKTVVTGIEKHLLQRFNPPCNSEAVSSQSPRSCTSSDVVACLTNSGLLPDHLSLRSVLVLASHEKPTT